MTLEALVAEWRDAREAVFRGILLNLPIDERADFWTRLGNAEDALMVHARTLERPNPVDSAVPCAMSQGVVGTNGGASVTVPGAESQQSSRKKEG